nr:uncharacterized protein LOC113696989 [Coffea arabica]
MAEPPTCNCGVPARVKTSWTAENPGKRFYGCAYYEHNGGGGCVYFKWYDTNSCERCDKLVRHTRRLAKRLRELEAKVEETRRKEKMMKLFLFAAFVVFIVQNLLSKD